MKNVSKNARVNDLIEEIDQFWIEVTGDGISDSHRRELESEHPDDLLLKLQGLKMEETRQYCEPFEVQPQY